MHDRRRTANLLGATALAVHDLAMAGATGVAGVSASGAAALVVLSASPEVGVTELGRRVGLSQSAAARMLDSLESRGLVARRPGQGRSVAVTLTPAGRRTAAELLAARGAPLADLVDTLDDDQHEALAELLATLLARLYGEVGSAELLCRLCDRGACTRDAVCPVGQAEREGAP
ncbi:MarR family winged helix-turn-helix transcriptional regulator [Spirillospora sp. CA-294931]|uniref:MarR family winged helix-turn-helix transcriptional regulator n=1 Tax=Spirillospora sp. CA-294931 TaxID=3240042 RepID=UPI003D8CE554